MGNKVTLPPVTVSSNSSYQNGLNQRLDRLADEFDKIIYRDGSQDLQGPLNANSKRIFNLPEPLSGTDPIRVKDLQAIDGAINITVPEAYTPTGTGAVTRTVAAKIGENELTPDDFDLEGDGTTDDAEKFKNLVSAALDQKKVIRLKKGRTYVLGAVGWAGIIISGSADDTLHIEGNGATIKYAAEPTNDLYQGTGKSPLKIINGLRLVARDVTFDLNSLKIPAVEFYNGSGYDVRSCTFKNGYMGPGPNNIPAGGVGRSNMSYGLYSNNCIGLISRDNYFTGVGHCHYNGHTAPGMHSSRVQMIGNRAFDIGASLCHGVVKHATYALNEVDGCFGPFAMPGYDGAGVPVNKVICENVAIIGNRINNFVASAVQADVVGTDLTTMAKNISIIGNVFTNGGGTATGIYLNRVENFTCVGNRGDNVRYGVIVNLGNDGTVADNSFDCGIHTAEDFLAGIYIQGSVDSPVSHVSVTGNVCQNFYTNIQIGEGQPQINNVTVVGNITTGGTYGLRVVAGSMVNTSTGVTIDLNRCTGASYRNMSLEVLEIMLGEGNFHMDPVDPTLNKSFGVGCWDFPVNATTPSVKGGRKWFRASNTSPTTITHFTNGYDGQTITIHSTNGNTTIAHGGLIVNRNSTNRVIPTNGFVTYRRMDTVWFEVQPAV